MLWALVGYTVLVIIWGAWVRISHSGDGCGDHWPLCEGLFIPQNGSQKTWIEYLHRLTSGLYGVFVAILMIWTYRLFPKRSAQRQISLITFILMIFEAGLGAALVLRGLVGENATIYRLVVMTFHQINSLLLVGSSVTWALFSRFPGLQFSWKKLFTHHRVWIVFILIPATGAWAALANTLFPSLTLADGLMKDFDLSAPWVLRLRIVHPFLALLLGMGMVWFFYQKSESYSDPTVKKWALRVCGVLVTALLFGTLTLMFLSPIWMKLVHLTLAQILWIMICGYVIICRLSTSR